MNSDIWDFLTYLPPVHWLTKDINCPPFVNLALRAGFKFSFVKHSRSLYTPSAFSAFIDPSLVSDETLTSHRELRSAFKEAVNWANSNNLCLAEADKNMGLCIILKTEYLRLASDLLDNDNYEVVDASVTTDSLIKRAKDEIDLCFNIEKERKIFLTEISDSKPAVFRVLIKLHKNPITGRPIVAANNCFSTFASKHITLFLMENVLPKLILKHQTVVCIHNGSTILDTLRRAQNGINPDEVTLCTGDVTNMYGNISIDLALLALEWALCTTDQFYESQRILRLTKWVLNYNYFTFNGKMYRQIQGIAMGSNVSPVLANITAIYLETKMTTPTPFLFACRFLDDVLLICLTSKLAESLDWFRTCYNPLKITFSTSTDPTGLPFLDYVFYRQLDKTWEQRIFQKEGNTHPLIPAFSSIPSGIRIGIVKTVLTRAVTHTSEPLLREQTIRFFTQNLITRGYSHKFIMKAINKPKSVWKPPEKGQLIFKLDYRADIDISAMKRMYSDSVFIWLRTAKSSNILRRTLP